MLQQACWRAVLDVPGLVVMCAGLRETAVECYEMPGSAGVALGKLFQRAGGETTSSVILTSQIGKRILTSGGRYLIGNYWGEYVCFFRDRKKVFVLQGPSAGRPMYRISQGRVHLYFSELADIAGKLSVHFSVNWDYVAAHVFVPRKQSEATGIREVTTLLGGHCDEISDAGRCTHAYWSPVSFARDVRGNVEDCARELRSVVERCVGAWAGCHDNVLHQLSGGLDSSIVLGCLKDAPTHPDVTCVTHYGRDVATDERPYARLAVEAAGCRHVEIPLQERPHIDFWDTVAPCPIPRFYVSTPQELEVIELARQIGASVVTSGNGGDAAFYQCADVRIATDYIHDHGFGPSMIEVIASTAALTQRSLGVVARAAIGGLWRRRRGHANILTEALKYRNLPSAAARASFCADPWRFVHPAVRDAADLPPAKFMHVTWLSQPMTTRSNLAGLQDPEYVHPIGSELITEFCLSTPAYILCREGQTRWLARIAFAGSTPPILLKRKTKGDPQRYIHCLVDQNRQLIRERLLEGQLIKEGILDGRELTRAIEGSLKNALTVTELLAAYSTEVWLKKIRETNQRSMAA